MIQRITESRLYKEPLKVDTLVQSDFGRRFQLESPESPLPSIEIRYQRKLQISMPSLACLGRAEVVAGLSIS